MMSGDNGATAIEKPVRMFSGSGEALAKQTTASTEVAMSRAAQEVQAAMVIAKKFPRDQEAAFQRIIQACKRKSLAEDAMYEFPKGGTKVSAPSIRMAECLAQNWGNIDFGVIELEQRNGESTVMSYAWDLETNARSTKVFQVKHERRVGRGSDFRIDKLEDPRDIYEMAANQGARRLRACILAVIPGDVVDAATAECQKTLAGNNAEPMVDRVRKMLLAFKTDFGVTQDMIEANIGHKLDSISEGEMVKLRKIFNSLKDGMGKREDFFDPSSEIPKPRRGRPPRTETPPTERPPDDLDGAGAPTTGAHGQAGRRYTAKQLEVEWVGEGGTAEGFYHMLLEENFVQEGQDPDDITEVRGEIIHTAIPRLIAKYPGV